MAWQIEFSETAAKKLRKLDRPIQKQILHYLKTRIATDEDPRRFGKALVGDRAGLWRYRIENYRVICKIQDEQIQVLILDLDHRKAIYRK